MGKSRSVQRYATVGLFFLSTLVAPALLAAVTDEGNQWVVAGAAVLASLAATIVGVQLLESWQGQRQRRAILSTSSAGRRRALVITAGPSHFAHDRARGSSLGVRQLAAVQPAYLAVVSSAESGDVEGIVREALDRMRYHDELEQMPHVRVFITTDANELSREAPGRAVAWCLGQATVERSDVVVDITGATKAMSLASYIVASDRRVDCQVIRQDQSGETTILR